MQQLTLRVPDELAACLKETAAEHGKSVNAFVTSTLAMVVDPEASLDEMPLLAERLARAGLLASWSPAARGTRPAASDLARAGSAATGGRPVADYVAEGRG